MFYEDSLITNKTAVCEKDAKWFFDSNNLHCFKGLLVFKSKAYNKYILLHC